MGERGDRKDKIGKGEEAERREGERETRMKSSKRERKGSFVSSRAPAGDQEEEDREKEGGREGEREGGGRGEEEWRGGGSYHSLS